MTELTTATRKLIASLDKAKVRRESGLFMAEGTKCVTDTLQHFRCEMLLATPVWLEEHSRTAASVSGRVVAVKAADIARMSQLSTPQPVIAVYHIPETGNMPLADSSQLILALDRIQDPGNLGTIVRLCDWFGVLDILASHDTVDVYSPKVVQATMGAISRVKIHYCDLGATLAGYAAAMPVYGTFLDGENMYEAGLSQSGRGGIIVMGNEGRGISAEVAATVSHRLLIPPYPADEPTSESLNVAMATAIMLAEFRRGK